MRIFNGLQAGRFEFEYTAPGTPQQNGHVEWKFATFVNRVCAMLNGGKISFFLRNGL